MIQNKDDKNEGKIDKILNRLIQKDIFISLFYILF